METTLEALQQAQGNSNLIFLEEHYTDNSGSDYYDIPETADRMANFYPDPGFPTTYQDGLNPERLGGYGADTYASDFSSRHAVASPLEMTMTFTKNGTTVNWDVTVKNTGTTVIQNLSINFMAYEDRLTARRHYVVRAIAPYQTIASLAVGATQELTASTVVAPTNAVMANVHGVSFAQLRGSATKEVLQGIAEPVPLSPPVGAFNPGWNWFSLPLIPNNPEASVVFQHDMANMIYRWNNAGRTIELYPNDFQNLDVNQSYLLFLPNTVYSPSYFGTAGPATGVLDFTSAGWVWVGYPHTGVTMLRLVKVKNLATGVVRAATVDAASASPWINWNWTYWDSVNATARICAMSGGDDTMLRAWHGYRVWANVGNLELQIP